jgi:hypothetical protein
VRILQGKRGGLAAVDGIGDRNCEGRRKTPSCG